MMSTKKVNPDIAIERKNCSFDSNEFALWWHGGQKKLNEKRKTEGIFLNDPVLVDKFPTSFLSHKEIYEESIRKSVHVFEKVNQLKKDGETGIDLSLIYGSLAHALVPEGFPSSTHSSMFVSAISGHGTKAQQDRWLARAQNNAIFGTYAQTELGHGTFVRGLETTATYDPTIRQFVMDSPTLSSYKWWPGGLGHTANHAVVMAQLYTHGKCHGVHPFIVQLRNEDTHMPLPGVTIGEIGNKLGLNGFNNGFLAFRKVHIPLNNMLMKHAQVLEDGTFVKPKDATLTYGTMVYIRVTIVRGASILLAKASTIAIRYSAVRRQSPINPNEPEPKVIEHLTQQNKLFPVLARSVIFKLSSDFLWNMYEQVERELGSGNLARLPELHALACCLKSVCSQDAAAGVEICRMACGGHGFMNSSGLPATYGFAAAAATYEGENTIMLLQTARYLIKAWKQALNGEKMVPTVAYLEAAAKTRQKVPVWNSSISGIVSALQAIAAGKLRLAYEHLEQRKRAGNTQEMATNLTSIELVGAADAHCRAFMLQAGFEMVEKSASTLSPALTNTLRHLIELHAVETCLKNMGDLLRFVNIKSSDIDDLQNRLEVVLANIRPNAVGLVDGFDFPDRVLGSALGVYDGNVYEKLYEEAKKSPLNQEPVNKSFHLYLKPYMQSVKANL